MTTRDAATTLADARPKTGLRVRPTPKHTAPAPNVAALAIRTGTNQRSSGVEDNVIERFGEAGVSAERIGVARETYTFEYPAEPTELLAVFREYYGPTMNAYAAAEANGRTEDLQKELADLFTTQNTSPNADATSIPATFLQVTVNV
jgi:hypothetical protein